jgi:hypothetical protein
LRFMFYLCYLHLFMNTDIKTRFPYLKMFVSFNSNATVTVAKQGLNEVYSHFSKFRRAQ